MDATFEQLVLGLPEELRRAAEALPYQLGLIPNEDGGFEDFVVLEPNRDLVGFAAENPLNPGELLVSHERLERFRRAHHLAVIHGLLLERGRDPKLRALRREVRWAWEAALGDAVGSRTPARAFARSCIAQTLLASRRARALERLAIAGGTLSTPLYAEVTCEKLRWFGATAQAMLVWLECPERGSLLMQAYDRFALSLQCLDDALDSFGGPGRNRPAKMPHPAPAGLFRAAPRLCEQASELSRRGGFHRLAEWFDGFHHTVDGMSVGSVPQHDVDRLLLSMTAPGN
jgi:hypothetical protein